MLASKLTNGVMINGLFSGFIKRFIVSELVVSSKEIVGERSAPFAFQVWQVFIALIMPLVGVIRLWQRVGC